MTARAKLPASPTQLRPAGMVLVGLTGGIATGKSLVTSELRRLGAMVVDADRVAREVVAPGSQGLRRVEEAFGSEYVRPDGTLNRGRLASLVFHEPAARRRLESILHPLISARIYEELERQRAQGLKVAVMDAPVLIEAGLQHDVDEIWVVVAPRNVQRSRLMVRDGLGTEEADARIDAQLTLEEKVALADRVIDNGGRPEETQHQVRELWTLLLARYNL